MCKCNVSIWIARVETGTQHSPRDSPLDSWTVPKRAAHHFGCHPVVALRGRRRSSRSRDAGSTTHGGTRQVGSNSSLDLFEWHWYDSLVTPRTTANPHSKIRKAIQVARFLVQSWLLVYLITSFDASVSISSCVRVPSYIIALVSPVFNVLSMVVLDFSAFYRSFSWFHLKDPRFFILNYGGLSWFLKVSGCQKTCSTSISPSPWPDLRFSFETRPLMRPGATSCAPRAPIIWHIPSRRIPSTWHTYGLC